MQLRSLRQLHFRNLGTAALRLEPGVTAVVGPNAAGKSNLLDACYLACSGDLPRGTIAEALRFGEQEGFVAAELERADGVRRLHVGLAPGKKLLRIDGQAVRGFELARVAAAVRITPEDAALVHGGPSERRDYLDRLVARLSPRYGALAREYQRVLEQRNALLKQPGGEAVLPVWSERLASLGDEVGALRQRATARVAELAGAVYAEVAGPGKPLWVSLRRAQGDRPLADALADSASEERARGVTVVGPHRDDLELTLAGRAVGAFGSRGEARTTALALRVAEYRLLEEKHDEAPVLLLDDFTAELDSERRGYLLELARACPQALVSGTEPPPHADRCLQVRDGEVREGAARDEVHDGEVRGG